MEPTEPTATGPTAPASARSSEQAFPHLGRLVGPDAIQDFLVTRFGRDAYRRRLPEGEASALFSWELLNQALAEHRLGPPRLKLEKGGAEVGRAVFRERRPRPSQALHDIDVPALYEHLRDGATLILDAVNELHAPLRQLSSGLATEFCATSQTNLYACWGQTQGFDVHWDDHDVFVVQLSGSKRWDLYGFTHPAPLRREPRPAPRPDGAPEQVVLRAGDMLYLPRGYWHAAVGLDEPSLHLTIGLSRKSGADFLHWLADEAVAEAAVRADLRLEQDDAVLGAQVADLLSRLAELDEPADLGRRYRRHVEARRSHRPELSLPHIGSAATPLGAKSRLRLTEGASSLEQGADPPSILLTHRGTVYTLAPELGAAMSELKSGQALAYAQMLHLCAAPQTLVEAFVKEMLRRGVLAIEPSE
jgi:ribosomal protein L16 Arg81 hydroxylase